MKKCVLSAALVLALTIAVIAYFAKGREAGTIAEPETPKAQFETTSEETPLKVTEAETTISVDNFNVLFLDLYFKYKRCITIADNGKWIKVDSNPSDFPYYNDKDSEAAIEKINTVLGFDLTAAMLNTTREDGRQSASNTNYVVAWSFSEEKGLEVIYAHKNS